MAGEEKVFWDRHTPNQTGRASRHKRISSRSHTCAHNVWQKAKNLHL